MKADWTGFDPGRVRRRLRHRLCPERRPEPAAYRQGALRRREVARCAATAPASTSLGCADTVCLPSSRQYCAMAVLPNHLASYYRELRHEEYSSPRPWPRWPLFAGSLAWRRMTFRRPVKARQGQFRILAINLGILGGMAKGETEYDAEAAQAAADTIGRGLWRQPGAALARRFGQHVHRRHPRNARHLGATCPTCSTSGRPWASRRKTSSRSRRPARRRSARRWGNSAAPARPATTIIARRRVRPHAADEDLIPAALVAAGVAAWWPHARRRRWSRALRRSDGRYREWRAGLHRRGLRLLPSRPRQRRRQGAGGRAGLRIGFRHLPRAQHLALGGGDRRLEPDGFRECRHAGRVARRRALLSRLPLDRLQQDRPRTWPIFTPT